MRSPSHFSHPRTSTVWAAAFAALLVCTLSSRDVLAQQPGADPAAQPGAQPETGAAPATTPTAAPAGSTGRPQGAYPKNPYGFYRGNGPSQRSPGNTGHYFSFWMTAFTLFIFLIWVHSSKWVNEDSDGLNLRTEMWNSIMLFVGVLGFLVMLVAPKYLGTIPMVAAYAVPFGLYVRERNTRVPDNAKVFTPEHIRKVVTRWLAKIGIHIGTQEQIEKAAGPPIRFLGKSDTSREEAIRRGKQVENSAGYMAAKELIYDAILRRATDVHLEPKEEELSARIRIDGVMYPTDPFASAQGRNIINIFKVLGAMDITERRRPQDGSFRAELDDRDIDFRAATQGTRHGEKISLRILDQSNSVGDLAGLGFRKALHDGLRNVVHLPHGLFLSCGPTGAGKSTTLYAAINDLDAHQKNIITVENPIEYKMENVNQIEINTKSGQSFAASLRSILRQDPDVVMIGEIRDHETADIACQAANTGHMVFSTVHANDTITALYRMLELGVEPFMIANSISAILGQRLARRLCPACKEPYKPHPEHLRKAGLPTDKIECFYRPPQDNTGMCPKCGGLGYYGRVGVFELLSISERMRDMIREKASMTAIKSEARKNGMLTMKEEGLRLVVRGVTSVQELLRVVK